MAALGMGMDSMRWMLVLAGVAVLVGCAAPPRDTLLLGHNLNDPRTIAALSEGLPQKERAAFATYALVHWPGSNAYCGRPDFGKDRLPATVGQAIDKTIGFERALEQKRLAERTPGNLFEQKAIEEKRLVDIFDQLTLDRDMLMSTPMPAAQKARKLEAINRQLDENRRARHELAAKMPPEA